jgi:hypothetical protein
MSGFILAPEARLDLIAIWNYHAEAGLPAVARFRASAQAGLPGVARLRACEDWCRWSDSNRHDFLRSQDFKSCASAISPHRHSDGDLASFLELYQAVPVAASQPE